MDGIPAQRTFQNIDAFQAQNENTRDVLMFVMSVVLWNTDESFMFVQTSVLLNFGCMIVDVVWLRK